MAIGGGSTTGLGKAIALDSGLPILAIPTTYAGSEMTPIYGLTEAGLKKTGKDPRVLPRTVIYDPELSRSLPVGAERDQRHQRDRACGRGALRAGQQSGDGPDGARKASRAIARALPAIRAQPDDIEARADALYGAWLCGSVLGNVGMALHHKLCHTLGGSFNLPHAEVHTVVLPHALAYNAAAAPRGDAAHRAGARQRRRAPQGSMRLAPRQRRAGRAQGHRHAGRATSTARPTSRCSNPYWNPRPAASATRSARCCSAPSTASRRAEACSTLCKKRRKRRRQP